MQTAQPPAPNPRRVMIASTVALLVGTVILFVAILPAEYGFDPLGTGRLLGLNALSEAGDRPVEEQAVVHRTDYVEFLLEPFQSVEYKYQMEMDAPMVFTWVADGELIYDMHAEPEELGEEYAESFDQGTAMESMGSYHAPFAGIHGWFWENQKFATVTVRLFTSGFYSTSTVFRDGGTFERELDPVVKLP
ncbi:MAG: hypothetical protein WDZ76_03345 [Pseudohongiellaceae bacterium]